VIDEQRHVIAMIDEVAIAHAFIRSRPGPHKADASVPPDDTQ